MFVLVLRTAIRSVSCLLCFLAFNGGVFGQDTQIKGLSSWLGHGEKTFGFNYCCNLGDRLAQAIDSGKVPQYVLDAEVACLNEHEITAKEIRAIATLKSIERLDIGIWPDAISEISNPAIDQIATLKNLKELTLEVKTSPEARWDSLKNLKSLELFHFNSCSRATVLRQKDLDAIGQLNSLTWLRMDSRFECQDFTWLTRMKSLRDLDLIARDKSGAWSSDGLRKMTTSFKDFPDLLHLDLKGIRLNEKNLTDLAIGCGNSLESMMLDFESVEPLEKLALFPKIDQLFLKSHRKEAGDLTAVSKLRHLETLKIVGVLVSDAELEKLRNHPLLERIELNASKLTTKSMDVLESLPSLNYIRLWAAPDDLGLALRKLSKKLEMK